MRTTLSLACSLLTCASLLPLASAMEDPSSLERPSMHKRLSEATSADLIFGQDILSIECDRKRPFVSTMIRMIFHGIRAFDDRNLTAGRAVWNEWVNMFGFNCEVFENWLRTPNGPNDVINFFKRLTGKLAMKASSIKRSTNEAPLPGQNSFIVLEHDAGLESYRQQDVLKKLWPNMQQSYEAIAVAVPKREKVYHESWLEVPHVLYLREAGSDNWFLIDESLDSYLTDFPDSRVAEQDASFVLYQSSATFNLSVANPISEADKSSGIMNLIPNQEKYTVIKSVARLFSNSITNNKLSSIDFSGLEDLLRGAESLATIPEVVMAISKVYQMRLKEIKDHINFYERKGVYFPKADEEVGKGVFSNSYREVYFAIAFTVPKDANNPNGPQLTYFHNGWYEYHWTMYDEQNGTRQTRIPHDLVAQLKPNVIIFSQC